jgi:hypothetical protein
MAKEQQDRADRVSSLASIEQAAEMLSVHQMDLLSQLEAQLRSARHTINAVNRLRDKTHRVGGGAYEWRTHKHSDSAV